MLLRQPAVSHLCFAERVPGTDRPGGYRVALGRVAGPIFSTFTKMDFSLTKIFHFALTRDADLGEQRSAGAPSKYAALGGYGPSEAGAEVVETVLPPQAYALASPPGALYGLKAHKTIGGHGDISNAATWWAFHTLLQLP